MDGATSVKPDAFKSMTMLMKTIYHVLPISSDGVNVGMVTFGEAGHLVFNLRQHTTIKSLDAAVDQVTLPGGAKNNVGAGLATTVFQLFGQSRRKETPRVKKAVVTLLVGTADDDPTIYSKKMQSENIVSIVIAINGDKTQADSIASSPDHVLLIDNPINLFDNLDTIIDMINKGKNYHELKGCHRK